MSWPRPGKIAQAYQLVVAVDDLQRHRAADRHALPDAGKNLYAVGRYGMFKYNNADHSILTALLAVENLYGAKHDLWSVNTDSDYHEIRKDPPQAR